MLHLRNIVYSFFYPWMGIPKNMDSCPTILALDESLTGTKNIFTVFPRFEDPFYIYEIRARFDDDSGTPVYGTVPKIEIFYFDKTKITPKKKPLSLDCQTSPGEGNQVFLKFMPDFQMQFGPGKKGFEVQITNFGTYSHLAMAFICRRKQPVI